MADLEQLKQKYQPVLNTLAKEGAQRTILSLRTSNSCLKRQPSPRRAEPHLDSIKAVDPDFADLKHNIEVQPGQQTYTVEAGDNLSEISKYFYGDADKYAAIVKADNLADPDKIRVGQNLVIPEG